VNLSRGELWCSEADYSIPAQQDILKERGRQHFFGLEPCLSAGHAEARCDDEGAFWRTPCLKDPRLFRQQAFVAGQWIDADDGAAISVIDPATGAEIGTVPALGTQETRRAIKTAEAAWPA
jgi:hypothetical protein